MSTGHEIAITNFTPDETVHYPVIIIKGYVKNNTCQNNEDGIFLNGNFFKIVGCYFKALAELEIGGNIITATYCCTSVEFSINYGHRGSQFSVLPLYVVCEGHDGRFQAPGNERNGEENACERITLGSKLLQSVIAEKLHEGNLGRKTFNLNKCRVFRSQLPYLEARRMTQTDLWATIGQEIINANLGHETTKFLGFLSCTWYRGQTYDTYEEIVENTEAHVALGGGGLALFGTGCLYTWPEKLAQVIEKFQDGTPVDRANFMDDSCYRGTLGACFSTTLGSVLHELCHTLDLGHTERGIMGRGFDDIWRVFVSRQTEDLTFWTRNCLWILAYHKWLNSFDSRGGKVVKFEPLSRVVFATGGLRVIELRNEEHGLVLWSRIFESRVLKYSFQIPESLDLGQGKVVLFVEDNIGNILKQTVNI